MKDLIPLVQTSLWVIFYIGMIIFLRREIRIILTVINERLLSGSGFKIGPFEFGELKKKVSKVEKKVEEANDKISKLFLATMAEPMYYNLKKFKSGGFGHYKVSTGLTRELYHLRDMGYIMVDSIKSLPEEGDDLSKYVKITEAGKKFVDLREGILNNIPQN